jgi:hypothetical protein
MATQAPVTKSSGTTQGTDQASAERNLRLEYENMKADERERKAREEHEKRKAKGMRQGGYVKAADGCAQRGKTRGKMV